MKRFLGGLPAAGPSPSRKHGLNEQDPIDLDADEEEEKIRDDGAPPLKKSTQITPPTDTGRPLTLADRMRPISLDQYVGQSELLADGALVRRLLEAQSLPSMIFWGPPGTGKTTLANIIAHRTKCEFVKLSAAACGLQQLKAAIAKAAEMQKKYKQHTILFIDEIHRFNKLQQDSLLGPVEEGIVTLIGATTENPSFECNYALLSRCRVLVLKKLEPSDILKVLQRGVPMLHEMHPSRASVKVDEDALSALSQMCDGDARVALNALEMGVVGALGNRVAATDIADAFQRSAFHYDKVTLPTDGDQHYNVISALHKSIRGSDANAAVYWVARMLEGGEDPMYIARRLTRCAAEDIGLADPQALMIAAAASQATHLIGIPECNVILAQLAIYLSLAPKSVAAYHAYGRAAQCVKEKPLFPVPLHICNAPTDLMKGLGYAKDYKYNPDYDEPVDQTYLPPELQNERFWRPDEDKTQPARLPAPPAAGASGTAEGSRAPARPQRNAGWQC